jgi:hypothetical protein
MSLHNISPLKHEGIEHLTLGMWLYITFQSWNMSVQNISVLEYEYTDDLSAGMCVQNI